MIQSTLPGPVEACRLLQDIAHQENHHAPRKVDKPAILYGAGELGNMAREFFTRLDIPVLHVVDQKAERYRGENAAWAGIRVLKPDDVPQEHRSECLLIICIATAPYTAIVEPLIQQGWRDIVPFYDVAEAYRDRSPLSNGWFAGTLSDKDIEGIEYALDHWDDDLSRAHHLQFIAWHTLREEMAFENAPITTNNRFFIPQILSAIHENEVFLDGGAYHGTVSLRFMEFVQYKFKQVFAVEPDKYNFTVLQSQLCAQRIPNGQNIHLIQCALGKTCGQLPFSAGLGYASQFSSMTQESVSVKTLDEMDIPTTFIKFHLEGWEDDALWGAMQTLQTHRPLLVATTYHKRNGLWQIPTLVMKNLQEYVFLFRLHAWMGSGSVLYAIPKERCSSW